MTPERFVSVHADLTVDIDDDRLTVRADGQNLVVQLPTAIAAFKVWRRLKAAAPKTATAADLSAHLRRVGLSVTIRTPKRRLLTIGREGDSWLLKLFGIRNTSLHFG